jgi:hypothetical protein
MGYGLLLPRCYLVARLERLRRSWEETPTVRGARANSELRIGVSAIGLYARSKVHVPVARLRAPGHESGDGGFHHIAIRVDVPARDERGGSKPAGADEIAQTRKGRAVVEPAQPV